MARRKRLSEDARFALMAAPGTLFIFIFLFLPILSIIVFSFWRTEVYQLYPDWNLDNYRVLLTTPTYMVFLMRSLVTASLVSLVCVVLGWPIAYFIIRYGGRYRRLMVLALAAPFFTGIILRVSALQGIMGPVGAFNMTLMTFGFAPVKVIMFSQVATGIGLVYLYIPFLVTAIYLSLLNFDFELLEAAKVNGAPPWRAFIEITWPLNWMGTIIGVILVFIPSLASSVTPIFLGGANGALFGSVLGRQFSETGTLALGSAMGVVLFAVSGLVIYLMWRTVNLRRAGFTGKDY